MDKRPTLNALLLATIAFGVSNCGGGGGGASSDSIGKDPTTIVPFAQLSGLTGKNFEILLPNRTSIRKGSVNLINLQPGDEDLTLGLFQTRGSLLISNGCSGGPEIIDGSVAFAVREGVPNSTATGVEPNKFYATPVDLTNQEATSFINGTYLPVTGDATSAVTIRVPVGMAAKMNKWVAKRDLTTTYQFVEEGTARNLRLRKPSRTLGTVPTNVSGLGYVGFLSSDAYFGATIIMRQPGQQRYMIATGHSINGYGPVTIPVSFADCVVLTDGSIDPSAVGTPFGTMIGDLRYGSVLDTQQPAQVTPIILTVNGTQADSRWIALLNGDVDEYSYNFEEMDLMVDNYFLSLTNLQGSATIHITGTTSGGLVYDQTQSVDSATDLIDLNDDIQETVAEMTQAETTQLQGQDLVSSEIDLTIPASS